MAVKSDELEMIYKIPATYADKFYLTILGNNARITFCESTDDIINARVAIMMPLVSAEALRGLLEQLLAQVKKGTSFAPNENQIPPGALN